MNYKNSEDLKWPINSGCETVHILSSRFQTQRGYDFLRIDGIQYSGDQKINQVVSENFTIRFTSDYSVTDDGFILTWECTEWGEWTDLAGTCNQQRRPMNNGIKTIGNMKYRKSNYSCSKLLHSQS